MMNFFSPLLLAQTAAILRTRRLSMVAIYSSIASSSRWKPDGSFPSFSAASNLMISCKLDAFLIMS